MSEYDDDIEVKPDHSTALLMLILSAAAICGGVFMLSSTNTAMGIAISQAMLIGGSVGFFLALAAMAIVAAIYKVGQWRD